MFSKFAAKLLLKSQAIQAGRGWHHRLRVSFVTVVQVIYLQMPPTHPPNASLLSTQLNEGRKNNVGGGKEV